MKPRFLISFLIFLSAYAPLSLIIAAKDLNWQKWTFAHRNGSLICLVIAVLSVVILRFVITAIPGQYPAKVISVKSRSGDLINYSIPYLVTFVTVDNFFEIPNLAAFITFMALMFILTLKTQNLFINPILAVWQYGLYDVQFQEGAKQKEGIFLVKGDFSSDSQVRILKLSRFLYLATIENKGNYEQR